TARGIGNAHHLGEHQDRRPALANCLSERLSPIRKHDRRKVKVSRSDRLRVVVPAVDGAVGQNLHGLYQFTVSSMSAGVNSGCQSSLSQPSPLAQMEVSSVSPARMGRNSTLDAG